MTKINSKRKKFEKTKDDISNLIDEGIESEKKSDLLNVDDIEKKERIKVDHKIDGIDRIKRQAEHPEKLTISKIQKKVSSTSGFNITFMPMHTSEITYDLVKKELIRFGAITDLVAEVNSGKEANIYIAHLKEAPLIVKIFRQQLTCHSNHRRQKGVNPQMMAAGLANAEYYRLMKAYKAGMKVPTPARKINSVILMQFVGSNWVPAPQLRLVNLEKPEETLDKIIEQLRIMYQEAKLIHGDFSEYNILYHNNDPIIIDFPQAIDMSLVYNRSEERLHRNLKVLKKDIATIQNFFEKRYNITFDFNEVYSYIAGEDSTRKQLRTDLDFAEQLVFGTK